MKKIHLKKTNITNNTVLLSMFIAVLLFMLLTIGGEFFRKTNITSMGFQIPEFGFLAIAMALSMISGGIDLSIIAIMNLTSILGAFILTNESLLASVGVHFTIIIAIVAIIISSLICGLGNGFLISYLGVPAILATLGSMMLYSGFGMGLTGGVGIVGFPEAFEKIGNSTLLGIPIPLILMLITFIFFSFLLKNTLWGKSLYLVGESKVAARFAGLQNKKVIIKTYMITGLLSGLAGIILMSRVNSGKIGYGNTYQLQAILVSVLGGVNPDGGSGDLVGILLAILILQSLQSAFTIFRFSPYDKLLIWGVILLVVMIINFYREKNKN